jgi:hypothetical protein
MRANFSCGLWALTLWVFLLNVPVFGQSSEFWSGQAQCQLTVQSQGYTHQETQTWTLTGGLATQQGAMQVYPATWSVTGQGSAQRTTLAAQWINNVPGMNAPLAIFVRASDNRLMIKSWHAQLVAAGGISAVRQIGATQTTTPSAAYEWMFPQIEADPSQQVVNGTGNINVPGNATAIPSTSAMGTANCSWQFSKGGAPQGAAAVAMTTSASPMLTTQFLSNNAGTASTGASQASATGAAGGGAASAAAQGNSTAAALTQSKFANTSIAAAGGAPDVDAVVTASGASAAAEAAGTGNIAGGAAGRAMNAGASPAATSTASATLQATTQVTSVPLVSSASKTSTTNSVSANTGPAAYAAPSGTSTPVAPSATAMPVPVQIASNPGSMSPATSALQNPSASTVAANAGPAVSAPSTTTTSTSATGAVSGTGTPTSKANVAHATAVSTLPAPTGFTARSIGDGSVELVWQSVSGAPQYHLSGTGIPSSGLLIAAATGSARLTPAGAAGGASNQVIMAGTRVQNVPVGQGTWQLAAMDAHSAWNPNRTATATAVVRYVPAHAGQWLTKNNGAGSSSKAFAHYLSLCPQCVPGMSFSDFLTTMGIPSSALADGNNDVGICLGEGGPCTWTDLHAARYENVTEFGTSRITRCWEAMPGNNGLRTVCYAKSADHGVTVIVKDHDFTWFLAFAWTDNPHNGNNPDNSAPNFPNPAKEVVNWFGNGIGMESNYALTTQLTFDSEGPKYPPNACLSCHGGKFDGTRVTGATLLPLDTGLLRIDDRSDAMATNFIQMNQAVMNHGPSLAVKRYLTGLYAGFPGPNSGWGDLDYVPQGWKQQSDFYKTAVRPYCMMCHLATPSNLDFSTYGSFAQNKDVINAEVCGGHTMPHAEYPFKQFWSKDTGPIFLPGYLVAALGITSCQ